MVTLSSCLKIVSGIGRFWMSGAKQHYSDHLKLWKPYKEDFDLETSLLEVVVTLFLLVGYYKVLVFQKKVCF